MRIHDVFGASGTPVAVTADADELQIERPLMDCHWATGFGPTHDPFQADLLGASFVQCRSNLAEKLLFWADRMALEDGEALIFRDLAEDVIRLSPGSKWHRRAHTAYHDLTFWLLPHDDAVNLHGASPKR